MSKNAIDFIDKLVKKDPNQRIEASVALKHPFLQNAEDI
jgi:serine/threonine protein kinase